MTMKMVMMMMMTAMLTSAKNEGESDDREREREEEKDRQQPRRMNGFGSQLTATYMVDLHLAISQSIVAAELLVNCRINYPYVLSS